MKVVLISTDDSIVGYGVRSLSSCLIENNFSVKIVFMPSESYSNLYWQDLFDICHEVDLIGISCMTHGYQKAKEVQKRLREISSAPIIIGGIHSTLAPEDVIKDFDLVCHGEGEDLIVTLAQRIRDKKSHNDIPGLWIKNKAKALQIKNISVPLKRQLYKYPFPDYDLTHQYILMRNRLVPIKPIPHHILIEDFVILGSRECPHSCTYCSNQRLKKDFPWRKKVRHYSVNYIIEHLKYVSNQFPMVRSFWIQDDTFFSKKQEEIEAFSIRYKKEVEKPFQIMISPWTYKEEKIKPLIDAGMNRLIMGIQSGSENTNINIYDRKMTNERLIRVARSLNKFIHMVICYDFIVLNPFETEKDLLSTVRFIRELPPPYVIYTNCLAFYPNTRLWERAIKEKLDISLRVRHYSYNIGYKILKYEKIQYKFLHFLMLQMGGNVTNFRIGKVPRFMLIDPLLTFYQLINNKPTNWFITGLSAILMHFHWQDILKKMLGPNISSKLRAIIYRAKDYKDILIRVS